MDCQVICLDLSLYNVVRTTINDIKMVGFDETNHGDEGTEVDFVGQNYDGTASTSASDVVEYAGVFSFEIRDNKADKAQVYIKKMVNWEEFLRKFKPVNTENFKNGTKETVYLISAEKMALT